VLNQARRFGIGAGAAALAVTAGMAAIPRASGGAAVAVRASGTSMFRGGPARTGAYEAASGRALVGLQWRVRTDGDVISSPTVEGGTVYVGSGDGRLYAIDLTRGTVRWRFDAGSPIPSSPAVGGGAVYAATRDGHVVAVDAETGALRWRKATGPDLPFPWGHESGDIYISSPALAGATLLYGAGDGRVYAVDARTGRARWHAATAGRVRSSPATDGQRVYVGSADGRVYAFDLATGARRWTFDTEGTRLESSRYGFDRRTVQASPAVSGGVVYVGARDGFLYAIDAESGKERWRVDHKVSWVNTSPAVRDGIVYAGSSDAQFVQAVDGATGQERWRAKAGVTWSSPAVTADIVYAGDGAGRLNAFDRATGKALWSFRTGSQVYSSPTPAGDLVIIGSTDGCVYAIRVGESAVERAVYLDSTQLKASWLESAPSLALYLEHRGYRRLDANGLGEFLRARAEDRRPSVVVFAMDQLPATAVGGEPARSPLRAYLDAGGKVIWPGLPPLLWPRDPATGNAGGLDKLDWSAPAALLGVPHDAAMFDLRGVRATADGARWGLPERWRAGWGIAPDRSITVLGRDEWGLASSWVRRYGGPEGTGFVRVPADDAMAVYLAAEYRPRAADASRDR
jgi:outer membrane protein assembly factor BamB